MDHRSTFSNASCKVSSYEWSHTSQSPTLQIHNSVSPVKSPLSPSQCVEDLVLEFEESGQEIGDVFPTKLGGSEFDPVDSDVLLSVLPQTPTKVCGVIVHQSDSAQYMQEDETMMAISPNKIHLQTGSENQNSCNDPLSLTALIADRTISTNEELNASSIGRSPIKQSENLRTINTARTTTKLIRKLAEVTHCQALNEDKIFKKATVTITKLKQQACELMATYSQLKYQNDELTSKKTKLQFGKTSEDNGKEPTMTIELLIPSDNCSKGIDAKYLYHRFPLEDDEISADDGEEFSEFEVNMAEPYMDSYDIAHYSDLPLPSTSGMNDCSENFPFCRLGCICDSLKKGRDCITHCRNPSCMLESGCTQSNDPTHTRLPSVPIMNLNDGEPSNAKELRCKQLTFSVEERKLASEENSSRPKRSSSNGPAFLGRGVLDKSRLRICNDPKLKQACSVRLVRLDSSIFDKGSQILMKKRTNKKTAHARRTVKSRYPRRREMETVVDNQIVQSSAESIIQRDLKLKSKVTVTLGRIGLKPDSKVYCMEHSQHGCSCLKLGVTN